MGSGAGRYRAFLSYSHADNREEGRKWADWLHRELETYDVPDDLVGRVTDRGVVPEALYPVFQDEKELPADADLAAPIRHALETSDTLIVLCSPRAVGSRYVNDEVRYFKQLGKADRVLAVMLEGEPNADTPSKRRDGMREEEECFPEALRHPVDGEGRVDRSIRVEPVAADVRPEGGRAMGFTTANAYREVLRAEDGLTKPQIETRVRRYRDRLDRARLKLLAGVLGVPLADLTKRDEAYQLRKARRRHRIFALVAVALALLAAVAGVAGWIATKKAEQATRAEVRAQRELEASRISESAWHVSRGNRPQARDTLWSVDPTRRAWEWGILLSSCGFAPVVLREGDAALLAERLAPYLDASSTTDALDTTLARCRATGARVVLKEPRHAAGVRETGEGDFEWVRASRGGALEVRWSTYDGRSGTAFAVYRVGEAEPLIASMTSQYTGILDAGISEDGSCLFVFSDAADAFASHREFEIPGAREPTSSSFEDVDPAVLVLPIPGRVDTAPLLAGGAVDAMEQEGLPPDLRLLDVGQGGWRAGTRGPYVDGTSAHVVVHIPFSDARPERLPHVLFDHYDRCWTLSAEEEAFLRPRLFPTGRYLLGDLVREADGARVLLVDMAGAAELWDLAARTRLQTYGEENRAVDWTEDDLNLFGGGAFGPHGRLVLVYLTGQKSECRIYERTSGRLLTTLTDQEGKPLDPMDWEPMRFGPSRYTSVFFSPRGTWCGVSSHLPIFAGTEEASGIAVFDPATGRPVPRLCRPSVGSFGWDSEERNFLTSDRGDIRVYDAASDVQRARWKLPGNVAGTLRPPLLLPKEQRLLFEGCVFDTTTWRLRVDLGHEAVATNDGTRVVRHVEGSVYEALRLGTWRALQGETDVDLDFGEALLLYQTLVRDEAAE